MRWVIPLLFCAACAIPEPPPGGPEDRTPPAVLGSVPAADSAGVTPTTEIRIEFSEKMTRRNLERSVIFFPPAPIGKARWEGNAVLLTPQNPLHPDTTYLVELQAGISDAHGVRTVHKFTFAFATSAHIDSGKVSGTVHFRRQPTERAQVRLWAVPLDSGFVAEAAAPQRGVGVDGDGQYTLGYLGSDGRGYVVWAFEDANSNGVFDPANEVGALLPDTVFLTSDLSHVHNNDIFVVDPTEPAAVTGTVINNTEFDTVLVAVSMREIVDSLPKVYYTWADREGRFNLGPLEGTYAVQAFIDFKLDSLCGPYPCFDDSTRKCLEPCVSYPDTVVIQPGDKVQLGEMVLGRPKEEE